MLIIVVNIVTDSIKIFYKLFNMKLKYLFTIHYNNCVCLLKKLENKIKKIYLFKVNLKSILYMKKVK